MSSKPTSPLEPRLRRGYALGGIASGTFGTVPGLLLLPYLTDVLGVAAGLAGLVVFLPKAWDFFMNPIAGRISDQSTNPKGHRRPMIRIAGFAMAFAFILLFWGPTEPSGIATVWVVVMFLAGATAYAFFQVPYLAMSAEITSSYDERTSLMTGRVIIVSLTILISGGSAPLLVSALGGAAGFRLMAVAMGVLIALGTVGLWFGTRGAPTTRVPASSAPFRSQVATTLRNRHARTLLLPFVLQAIAMTMVLAGITYTARHVIGDPTAGTYAFLAFVGPAIIITPLWARIGLRIGKKRGYLLASSLLGLGLLAMLGALSGNMIVLLLAAAVAGCGYAGAQLFPLAMLPDVAATDQRVTGENRIGMLTGVWAGFEVLGFAIGPAIFGAVLAIGGYLSGTSEVMQPSSAQTAIVLGISVIPATLVALSIFALLRYRLDDELRTGPPIAHHATGTSPEERPS